MKELSIYQRRTKPLVQEKDQSANKKAYYQLSFTGS